MLDKPQTIPKTEMPTLAICISIPVTDHSEYMGMFRQMLDKDNPLSKLALAEAVTSTDEKVSRKTFTRVAFSSAMSWPFEELIDEELMKSVWQRVVQTADRHYEPGKFTTFPAYEWSAGKAKEKRTICPAGEKVNLSTEMLFLKGVK